MRFKKKNIHTDRRKNINFNTINTFIGYFLLILKTRTNLWSYRTLFTYALIFMRLRTIVSISLFGNFLMCQPHHILQQWFPCPFEGWICIPYSFVRILVFISVDLLFKTNHSRGWNNTQCNKCCMLEFWHF